MPDLKRLIAEIHRRSLWQVLGIYIVGAWVAYQVVLSLAEGGVLPAWFPGVAVGLFLVGLPIVLATAFVQEGLPAGGAGRAATRVETGLQGDDSALIIPAARRGPGEDQRRVHRVLTWANALGAGVLIFAVAGAIGLVGMAVAPQVEASLGARSVGIMPFVNTSPEEENQYFTDGLTEELLNALARLPGLKVPARTSSFALRAQDLDIREAGRRLGVEYMVDGSVRRFGDRVRITAQLVRTDNGFHVWSETYDREVGDIFAVQDDIARAIAAALRVRLADDVAVATGETTPAAHDHYLLGLSEWNRRTIQSLNRAVGLFEQATEEDPDYARAYAGMALAALLVPIYDAGASSDEYMARARTAAERALELDSTSAEAHTALGDIFWRYDYRPGRAEAAFQRAIAANPNYATAHQWYGELLLALGRHEEGLASLDQALALDRLSLVINALNGLATLLVHGPDAALSRVRRAIEVDPAYGTAHSYAAMAWHQAGRADSAAVEVARWLELTYRLPRQHVNRIIPAVAAPEDADAVAAARATLADPAVRSAIMPATLAGLHALIGDQEGALDQLERAHAIRAANLGNAVSYPYFDPIRDTPRFRRIVEGMGLR